MNTLYFGDNLDILRESIASESIDLIYLDPPFNSNASYNILFTSPKGHQSPAQITAFEDTWHWGEQAEKEFGELIHQSNTDVSEMMQALRRFLGENDMMAYLTMMGNRLLELHRVLKPTGSLYLHCDPTASHYLKVVLDGVFGVQNFRNEIVWQRFGSHNDPRQFGRITDSILFYSKTSNYIFNPIKGEYSEKHLATRFNYEDEDGRRFWPNTMLAPGGRGPRYEWNGHTRNWRFTKENMTELENKGEIYYSAKGMPYRKNYLDSLPGQNIQNLWTDIKMTKSGSERLGYPTQKPLALLERMISASSNEGDVVLDPFCGCGTAIHAAHKLQRDWVGIDITHLAISLVEKRLKDAFPGIAFEVHGVPKDFDSARDLAHRDKYQFQWWACSLVNAQPYQGRKKGADSGIDGLIFFQDDKTMAKKIIVSVKGGENVSVPMIRDLGHVVDREGAAMGLFVTLADSTRPMREEAIKAGYYESATGASFPKIQILTVKGLLDGTERPNYPDLTRGGLMFNKAKREQTEKQRDLFGARQDLPQAAEPVEPYSEDE